MEIKACMYRDVRYTEGCGGAAYWWCIQDDKQINVYEDCKNCVEEG